MEIIPAKESDIIEALYIIKISFDSNNVSASYWRPPIPDFGQLKDEIVNDRLYMIRDKNVSIGTLTFSKEIPETYKKIEWKGNDKDGLVITRIAIVPAWLNDNVEQYVEKFLDSYAKDNNFKSIRLDVYTTNDDMNKFYQDLGFELKNPDKKEDFETPFNYYEKVLE